MVGLNHIDGIANVAMMRSVLEQAFLRIEDVQVGAKVKVCSTFVKLQIHLTDVNSH